jgi:hypothetical protein
MEFPEDVLTIIREYSKPRMRFVSEYNAANKIIGKSEKLSLDVKAIMYTSDAERMKDLLVELTHAHTEHQRLFKLSMSNRKIQDISDSNEAAMKYLKLYNLLSFTLYGEN